MRLTKKQIESADVIYTDKTASELGFLALKGEKIEPFFTTPDDTFQMGIEQAKPAILLGYAEKG